jgi:hypothetical protein
MKPAIKGPNTGPLNGQKEMKAIGLRMKTRDENVMYFDETCPVDLRSNFCVDEHITNGPT